MTGSIGRHIGTGELSSVRGRLTPGSVRVPDAIGVVAVAALAGGLDKGTAGDRYQVVLHVDAAALRNGQTFLRERRTATQVRAAEAQRARSRGNADGRGFWGRTSGRGEYVPAGNADDNGTPWTSAVAPDGRSLYASGSGSGFVAQRRRSTRLPWSTGAGNFSLRNFRICSIRASSASPVRN